MMKNEKNVLITGGTGLVGHALCNMLAEKGYSVTILTRSTNNSTNTTNNSTKLKKRPKSSSLIVKNSPINKTEENSNETIKHTKFLKTVKKNTEEK